MNREPIFSQFGCARLQLDPLMPRYVALEALVEIANSYDQAADTWSSGVYATMLGQIEQGPPASNSLASRLDVVVNSPLREETNPTNKAFSRLAERCADDRNATNVAVSSWKDNVTSELRSPESELGQATAAAKLLPALQNKVDWLREKVRGDEAELEKMASDIREQGARIEKGVIEEAKAPKTTQSKWKTPRGKAVLFTVAGVLFVLVLTMIARVPFRPYPVLGILVSPLVGLYVYRRAQQTGDEEDELSNSAYNSLRPQLKQYAGIMSRCETRRRTLDLTTAIHQEIRSLSSLEMLDGFAEVRLAVANELKLVPNRTCFIGTAPDLAFLTGRTLARNLWNVQRNLWSTGRFESAIVEISSGSGLAGVLRTRSSADAAQILIEAALATIQPVSLSMALSNMVRAEYVGWDLLIGEMKSQMDLLIGLLPIASHVREMPEDACPTLVHIGLPEDLMELMVPIIERECPRISKDFFLTSECIEVVAETFNWLNSERQNHAFAERALNNRRNLAETEQWSSFECLKKVWMSAAAKRQSEQNESDSSLRLAS